MVTVKCKQRHFSLSCLPDSAILPSMVPLQVFHQWHNNLCQRVDPAEKNHAMMGKKKKRQFFFQILIEVP